MPIRREFEYGNQKYVLETAKIAKQADGSVMVYAGDTVVLCTVVGVPTAKEGQSFFPLTVNYQEKTYAAGRIPGSFFRREGRPSEQETLICRLIDRPIRPLFSKGFMNEVQLICTVMSSDPEIPPDVPALIGAGAALSLSGLPFAGPLGAARVGFNLNESLYVLNPTYSELEESALNMVVAGTKDAVLMVESEADELPENLMLGGVLFAHQELQKVIAEVSSLAAEAGKETWDYQPPEVNETLKSSIEAKYQSQIEAAISITDKTKRQNAMSTIRSEVVVAAEADGEVVSEAIDVLGGLHKRLVRNRIISKEPRIDGRDTKTVRPIDVEVGMLPRAHGSALFTRGETQAIVTATLGPQKDAALVEDLRGLHKEGFLFHYNFPPYSVGEAGFMGGPKRREIGHGNLARRSVVRMLPNAEDFPYTLRVVSEITESNGSSSMASVCGASLALMDAGVPMKSPIAGVAMGLVMEGDEFAVLTDIMGDEDHLGDMDFKVAGSENGVTALQMDIKISGITSEIMEQALDQAKVARLHILEKMNDVLSASRDELSKYAPSFKIIHIPQDKIRDVIGKGGATIRAITEETGASIDINDTGAVTIYGITKDVLLEGVARVEEITAEAEVGQIYEGVVKSIVDFGAFIEILPGKQGLVHISQITGKRIDNVSDYLTEGETVEVVVSGIDNQGRIKLSMKGVDGNTEPDDEEDDVIPTESQSPVVGQCYEGIVRHVTDYGGFVEIMPGTQGLVHRTAITEQQIDDATSYFNVGQEVYVRVASIDEKGRISLALGQSDDLDDDDPEPTQPEPDDSKAEF